jgi:hypothetical protein
MDRRTVIRKALVGLGVAVVVAGGAFWLLLNRPPNCYRPVRLAPEDRAVAMREFRTRLMDFSNQGQMNEPFTWAFTEESLNCYLDSMDEIAAEGGAKAGAARRAMEKVHLADPAVALDGGVVTVMARQTEYDKIISARLALEITPDGKLRVRLEGVKVGSIPVPDSMVHRRVEKYRATLAGSLKPPAGEEGPGGVGISSEAVGVAIGRVIAAIDGDPVDPELSWRVTTRKRVRIDRIEIKDGRISLHVVPVAKKSAKGG